MKKFFWVLFCPNCYSVFEPSEDDLDGDITCPRCDNVDKISNDSFDDIDIPDGEEDLPN